MTSLSELLYSLYETTEQDRPLRTHLPTASDGLASICERFAWYEANAARARVINTMLRRRMNYGNIHEDTIRGEIQKLVEEKRLEGFKGSGYRIKLWGVAGRLDGLLKKEGKWYLLEVKTMNPEDFKLFEKEGLQAFPRYYEQFMFYMAACAELWGDGTKSVTGNEVTRGILLAENTWPLGELCDEELEIDWECVEQMKRNSEHLSQIIPLPEPPTRPFSYDSKQCSWCFRRSECWEVRQEEKTIHAADLARSEEFVHCVMEYLKWNDSKRQAEDELDEVKSRIREIMDEEKVTQVEVPISSDFDFTVTLSQVPVLERTVRSYSFPRLDIRNSR